MLCIPFLFILFATFTRLSLSLYNLYFGTIAPLEIPGILLLGFLFDLKPTFIFAFIAMILEKFLPKRLYLSLPFIFIALFFLTFQFFAEWTFWVDMDARFNFIAVDYLIYTKEVINNIRQSYPMNTYFALMALVACGGTFLVHRFFPKIIPPSFKRFALPCAIVLILPAPRWSQNNFAQELSENGTSNFVQAYFHNQLNYIQFYKTVSKETLHQKLTNFIPMERAVSIDPIARKVPSFVEKRKLNVVLIVVESLSQEFLDKGWTPFVSELEKETISLKDHYATGTRTVKGLEALSLSVPPTPGTSILRRPHNRNLYTIASVLKPEGYEMLFWYGGYGYFDNMNAFFGKNSFNVKDRLSIPSEKVEHETVWGVSDEHLLDAFIEDVENRKTTDPFFALIMTTSNHRPYTFPKNRISMPQGTREAAVRYTDWAIQRFFEKVRTLPWFENTLFVITADHCASSAGKLTIDPSKYHTPCLFYAPNHLSPQLVTTRTSQIDVAPTILGLLGISYESRFYGVDQIHTPLDRPVPIGTYQRLGFYGSEGLVILSPKREVATYATTPDGNLEKVSSSPLTEDAISLYQSAYERYTTGLMNANL